MVVLRLSVLCVTLLMLTRYPRAVLCRARVGIVGVAIITPHRRQGE